MKDEWNSQYISNKQVYVYIFNKWNVHLNYWTVFMNIIWIYYAIYKLEYQYESF